MAKSPTPIRPVTRPVTRATPPAPRQLLPLILGGVGLLVLLGLGALIWNNLGAGSPNSDALVERAVPVVVADTAKGPDHVQPSTVKYNSNPPVGGDHWGTTATWGIQLTAPRDEMLVHNLEHGGVIVWYNPAKVDAATVDKMKTLVRALQSSNIRVILTPRESIENDKAIAMTAWGWLATLDSYDEGAIRAFYQKHIAQGPECRAGQCPQ